jgi:Putative threonine efflux protein
MDLGTWAGFAAASLALLAIPGPTMLLVASYAMGRGWRVAAPMAAGVALGDLTAMSLSLLGLGAVLASSATLFTAVKYAGAAYLMFLGLQLWRSGVRLDADARRDAVPTRRLFAQAWLVTTLNPKSVMFFVAFVPQFLDPAAPFAPQATTLIATFVTLAFAAAFGVATLAAGAGRVAPGARLRRAVSTLGGGALMAAGLAAAFSRLAAV